MTQIEADSRESDPGRGAWGGAPSWAQYLILLLILLVNVLLKAPNLGHPPLKTMDESFHAVVARNLLYHPFEPMLVRQPVLPYDRTDWLQNHIWLHKPVLPLWIIAISLKCFGIGAFALRFPSLILSTLAVALTFLIARQVYEIVPACVAAAIQAIVPEIGMIVHGYVFSDAIDINLLFWSELSLFLMMQRNRKWIWLSGAAAGAAFLSKTFPSLFVLMPLILVTMLHTSRRVGTAHLFDWKDGGQCPPYSTDDASDVAGARTASPRKRRLMWNSFAPIFGWLIAFVLVVAPWNIYCAIRFPVEFTAEYGLILTHLSGNVENWASPWDRVWFQHLPTALYLFWTTSLVGSILLTFRAIQLKKWEWLFAPVWAAAVLIPFTLATSKTPSATLIAWPALMMGAGFIIWRACQGYLVELVTALTLLVAASFFSGKFITMGWGNTEPLAIMKQAQWIAWHIGAGLLVAAIALLWDVQVRKGRWLLILLVAAAATLPVWRTAQLARRVSTGIAQMQSVPAMLEGSDGRLPSNAVIFVTKSGARRRNEAMFYLDRTVYVLPDDQAIAMQMFQTVRKAGGEVWIFNFEKVRGENGSLYRVAD